MTEAPTAPSQAEALVHQLFEAFRTADRPAIEAALHPQFTFTSPHDAAIDRVAYFERCWPAAGTFGSQDILTVAVDEQGAFVLYEGRAADGGGFRNVERFRFKDGQVLAVEVFFGRPPA